ncbi:hypothetical protein [Streptomyces sp. NPDC015350]|uniref:hypothetical protein n=1 Tax=Streptomyces sp. NPDC015350 TaxID=3364955 RepID=UPI00370277E3
MAASSSRSSFFRTAEYWAAIEAIADNLIHASEPHARRVNSRDACRVLQMLSSRGFGPMSLFDLCALLILAVPRSPAEPASTGTRSPAMAPPTGAAPTALTAEAVAELKRGPVTVAAYPTERQIQHLEELEGDVAKALLISPEHPRARTAVRRALMARGRTARDAIAIYGIVCALIARDTS